MWTHNIDPTLFTIPVVDLQIRYYGLMYVISFLIAGQILNKLSKDGFLGFTKEDVDRFVTSMMIGMFLGARLVYVFVYNWDYYSHNLIDLLSVWKGGLSFHGAIIGFCVTMYWWSKKKNLPYFQISDSLALCGTIGLFFGRLGNFINGELYGRVTDVPWAIVFSNSGGGPLGRHPSQLYEGILEGILLFIILWVVKPRVKRYGVLSAIFLCGYASFRFFVEFFREADSQLGYYFGGAITMGQILCFLMFLAGVFVYLYSKKQNHLIENK